jgi:hypothetical protein
MARRGARCGLCLAVLVMVLAGKEQQGLSVAFLTRKRGARRARTRAREGGGASSGLGAKVLLSLDCDASPRLAPPRSGAA